MEDFESMDEVTQFFSLPNDDSHLDGTEFDVELPDLSPLCSDVIFYLLFFLETKHVIPWLTVSKYWYERCHLVPISAFLSFNTLKKVENFVDCPQMMNLTRLKVSHVNSTTCGKWCEKISSCPQLKNVTSLDLSRSINISSGHLKQILSSPYLTKLIDLDISNCATVGDPISSFPHLCTIQRLNISYNRKCNVESIVQSEIVSNLTSLNVFGVNMPNSNAKYIASSSFMQNLTELHLGFPSVKKRVRSILCKKFSDAGVESITNSSFMRKLRYLYLKDGKVTDVGAKLLANSELRNLLVLDLSDNNMTTEGQQLLSKSSNLSQLTLLKF